MTKWLTEQLFLELDGSDDESQVEDLEVYTRTAYMQYDNSSTQWRNWFFGNGVIFRNATK